MQPQFYSQHGEDYLVWKALGRAPAPGYYVEVGALDGRRFSNSYAFEKLGWSGVCVEAHPDYYRMTVANRPGARVIHAACCDRDQDAVTFYTNRRGSLSALEPMDPELIQARFSQYFHGYEPVQVPARTLTSILDEAGAPACPDMVSIDVEGHELHVLRGLDFRRFRPRIIVVEALGGQEAAVADAFLDRQGYGFARQLCANRFYTTETHLARVLARQWVDVPLHRTAHPLDPSDTDTLIAPAPPPRMWTRLRRLLAG